MSASPSQDSEPREGGAWQAAIDHGIDVHQLEYLMSLTPEERLRRHDQALGRPKDLEAARELKAIKARLGEAQ